MRVGVLGGTFDPIHLGHMLISEEAMGRLSLEEIIFVPTGNPWMKEGRPLSPAYHRVNMVRLAISANPFFRCSQVEVDREGYTYTVDTLVQMRNELDAGDEIYFILGSDSLKELGRWKEPARVLELCTPVAVPRPGHGDLDLAFLDDISPSASGKVVVLEGPEVEISGTDIRRRAREGVSVRYHVPDQVHDYIHRYGLYRDQVEEAG